MVAEKIAVVLDAVRDAVDIDAERVYVKGIEAVETVVEKKEELNRKKLDLDRVLDDYHHESFSPLLMRDSDQPMMKIVE